MSNSHGIATLLLLKDMGGFRIFAAMNSATTLGKDLNPTIGHATEVGSTNFLTQ
jgi:hypothetical protein